MFCPYCGNQINDGSTFCPLCGKKLGEPAQEKEIPAFEAGSAPSYSEPASPVTTATAPVAAPVAAPNANASINVGSLMKNKLVLIGLAAVALIIIIILIACAFSGGGAYTPLSTNFYTTVADETLYVFDGKTLCGKGIDTLGISSSGQCLNGSANVIITRDQELYIAKNKDLQKIAEDVQYAAVSGNGNVVAYLSDGDLYRYDGKSTKLTEVFEYGSIVISNDGSAIGFNGSDDSAVSWCGGKVKEWDDFSFISISDGGSIAYVHGGDNNKLGVLKNLNDEPEYIKSFDSFIGCSTDFKTILFTSGGKSYIYNPSMAEPIKIDSSILSIVYPDNCRYTLDNFDSFIAAKDYALYRFTRNGDGYDSFKIASASGFMLSRDGKTLLYVSSSKLYKIDTTKEDAERVKIASDVVSFDADVSLTKIYYSDYDEVFFSNGKDDSEVSISDDCSGNFSVTDNGVCVFECDDELYFSENGGKKEKIKGLEDVSSVTCYGNNVYVISDDTLYMSADGKNFEKTKIEY